MNKKLLLIETIRIQNGRVRHIQYHNQRCNASRKALFGSKNNINLRNSIDVSKANTPEVKCRIIYDDRIHKVDYESYTMRSIQTLEPVEIGDFDYSHKYADRETLKSFFDQRGSKDDILMTRKGFITDTYYANVALLKSGKWYTPKNPLLNGSCRSRLIDSKEIIPLDIHINQLIDFESISLFNAMIPLKKLIIGLQNF
ncbi:MAG: aminotransferase class IV [Bacteroidota bacterium]